MTPLLTLTIAGITALASVGAAWLTGGASAERRASAIELSLTGQVASEASARSVADTKLEGEFAVVNQKIDDQTKLITALMDGLGVKYTLPKQETKAEAPKAELLTKEERKASKAGLVTGTAADGSPITEQ